MLSEVKIIFDEEIAKRFQSNEAVKNFLLRHERREICLNNLCAEISRIEGLSINFNAEKYRYTIAQVVNMFATRALEVHEQKLLSNAERRRREDENRRIEIAKETLQEFEGGIFKDIIE